MAHYENFPVDCQAKVDFSTVAGKTVILTGGSSGLGFAYLQALVNAGAFVVNGDIKPPPESFFSDRALFVQCDVGRWNDQANMFRVAKEKSPKGAVDVVIANAGIYGPDALDGLTDNEPKKPNTKLLDINLTGVIYTAKLAGWYFHHQEGVDKCLILISSIMGYIDTQGSSIYSAAKHGVRGLMTCLRRKGLIRVNCVAPWFIATPIMPDSFVMSTGDQLRAGGLDFALIDDAVTAIFQLMGNTSINGRTLGIVPRQLSPSGYMDLEQDDFEEKSPLHRLQSVASTLVYRDLASS